MLGGTVGPTIASDTLWSIATKVRSNYATISVHQVMLALLRANPGAFSNGNINRLKRGVILELPKPGDIQKTPTIEALSEVKRQNDEWDTHRSLERPATRASEIVGGSGALTKSSPISLSEARLELVAPGVEDGGQAQAWLGEREELLREELDASIQQSDELTAKLTEAEEIIELLQRQVTIKDEELATLQHRLAKISVENDSIGDNNNERAVARDPHLLVSTSPLNNLFPDEFLSKFPGGAPALLVAVVLGFAGFCVIVVQFLVKGGDFDGASTDNQMANQATDEDFATRLSGDTEGSGMEDEVLIEDVADFELTLDSATEIDEVLVGSGSGLPVDGEDETRSGVDEYASLDDLVEHDVSFDDKYSELDNSSSGALDTKLDLAKAYIELGDEAGARSILDEVNARGNDAQKMEANSLLKQLSS
jgi:FimV-like protein